MEMKLSVIGLGKLGLCTAMCFAEKGIQVIGVDNNERLIKTLALGNCPIEEPGLSHLIEKAKGNVVFTTDYSLAIKETDITMVIVPTPSKPDGSFDNSYIEQVLLIIAPYLKQKKTFHIIDIVSTVMPGSCAKVFIPLIEKETDKRCGEDFGLVYNPEFIAIGSVIRDFKNPDMVLIGGSDETSTMKVKSLYEKVVENRPEYKIMSLINAEITKLALNCYITMKISFANELGKLCECIEGANVDIITDAIGSDSRVGKKCLKAGLGFGGPCFPRDNKAFQALAKDNGLRLHLANATVEVNNEVIQRLEDKITSLFNPPATIAILGLAYKAGTHITEASQAMMLVERLNKKGYRLNVHDPKALRYLDLNQYQYVTTYEDPLGACLNSNCAVLMLDTAEYRQIDWSKLNELKTDYKVFDPWKAVCGSSLMCNFNEFE